MGSQGDGREGVFNESNSQSLLSRYSDQKNVVNSNHLFDLSQYDFKLPEKLIAQQPIEPRDHSKLLVLNRKKKSWQHFRFFDLPQFLNPGDLLVANNSKVFRSRLLGRRIFSAQNLSLPGSIKKQAVVGGKIEFLMLEELEPRKWLGIFKSAARQVVGLKFEIPIKRSEKKLIGTIVRGAFENKFGTIVVEFDDDPLKYEIGEVPLPPYIKTHEEGEEFVKLDHEQSYQTLYAKIVGSSAAPTAGFHFTEQVLDALKQKRVGWLELTLHVGLGTFRPIKSQDIRNHQMHEERFEMNAQVANALNQARLNHQRIGAVGTTSVRALETLYRKHHEFVPEKGRTDLFLYPSGKEIVSVDFLITNFHLPKSSLLILVCAFAGRDLILATYQEAMAQNYRFYSYGDAMLII